MPLLIRRAIDRDERRVRTGRFHLLWAGVAVANLADGILLAALPMLAVRLTRDPGAVAGVRVSMTIPWLLFGLVAGAVVDRVNRGRIMVGASLARAAILVGFAVTLVRGPVPIGLLYLLATAAGVAAVHHDTAAGAFTPALVGGGQLARANGRLYGTNVVLAQFVGLPLGGVLVGAGVTPTFAVPAGLYLLSCAALLAIPRRFGVVPTTGTRGGPLAAIKYGLQELWRLPALRYLAAYIAMSNLASSAFMAVLVLYAVGPTAPMGLNDLGYGLLLAAGSLGAASGAWCAPRLIRGMSAATMLTASALTLALAYALPVVTADAIIVGAGFTLAGLALAASNVLIVTMRQTLVASELLGRVIAGMRLITFGVMPLGALVGGAVAGIAGPSALFAALACMSLAVGVVSVRWRLPGSP